MPNATKKTDASIFDKPEYWFVRLVDAANENNPDGVEEAQQRLLDRGFKVEVLDD